MSTEKQRLAEIKEHREEWQRWGPYLSERSWGTVREDYSAEGDAWSNFTHDMARSKTYRWGEDGLAGICDRYQMLCFALALWNGRDPILKERAFGLIPSEGNHGEDVKEYYFYVDSTPTHSYMKYLYKYPQAEYPYQRLIDENRARGGTGPEFELLDTGGIRRGPLLRRVRGIREGRAGGHLHPHRGLQPRAGGGGAAPPAAPVVPQHLGVGSRAPQGTADHPWPVGQGFRFSLMADDSDADGLDNLPFEYKVSRRILYGEADGKPLFTDNESNLLNAVRARGGRRPQVREGCLPPAGGERRGGGEPRRRSVRRPASTTCARSRRAARPWCGCACAPEEMKSPLAEVDRIVATRLREADEFYDAIHPRGGQRGRASRPAPGVRRPACGPSRTTSSTWTGG